MVLGFFFFYFFGDIPFFFLTNTFKSGLFTSLFGCLFFGSLMLLYCSVLKKKKTVGDKLEKPNFLPFSNCSEMKTKPKRWKKWIFGYLGDTMNDNAAVWLLTMLTSPLRASCIKLKVNNMSCVHKLCLLPPSGQKDFWHLFNLSVTTDKVFGMQHNKWAHTLVCL